MHDIVNATSAVARSFRFSGAEQCIVERHAARHQTFVARFGDAVRRGDCAEARRFAEKTIRSPSATVTAEIRRYRGTDLPRPSFPEMYASAINVRPSSALREPAVSWMHPKLGAFANPCDAATQERSWWRPLLRFGRQHTALNTICEDLLKAALPPSPREYNQTGRGDERMTLDIAGAMREGAFDHIGSIDITNCFGSVGKEAITRLLPLPRWLTETTVLINEAKRVTPYRRYPTAPLVADEVARAGLPQGASASGLIMSRAILGPLLAATPFANETYVYVDNVFVLAQGRAEAEARLGTLQLALANSSVGPLHIGPPTIQSKTGKINLLKYALQPIAHRYGGGMRFVPSQQSFRNFFYRVQERLRGIPSDEVSSVIETYIEHWLRAFPLYQTNETNRQYLRSHAMMAYNQMGL